MEASKGQWTSSFSTILFLLCIVQQTYAELKLTSPLALVQLPEKQVQSLKLSKEISCKDTVDNKVATRVYMKSVTPSSICGDCFSLRPEETNSGALKSTYSLWYVTGQGTFNYQRSATHTVEVQCADDAGNTVTSSIVVQLQPNSPPYFTKPPLTYKSEPFPGDTKTKGTGEDIFQVIAKDDDVDPVFYTMTTETQPELFEIGYTDGFIRAKKDLSLLCEDSVDFHVRAFDPYNDPVGPIVVNIKFKKINTKPVLSSTKTVYSVDEHPYTDPVGTAVIANINVEGEADNFYWRMRAEPERGIEYYEMQIQKTRAQIKPRARLDYEYELLRSVKLYFDVSNGFCESDTYSVTIQIEDVNEEPELIPNNIERTVYEGFIELDPGWLLYDPDLFETHSWEVTPTGTFHIDTDSGVIFSTGEFDIDPNKDRTTRTLKPKVKDKDDVKHTATLKLTILDKNDNAPYFSSRLYSVSATPCTKVGALIGQVFGKDDDSEFQGNNRLYYWGAGGNITVLGSGHVALKTLCVPGHAETIQAFVSDQGTYPGPLTGVPATVEFACSECPDPVANAGNGDDTTPSFGSAGSGDNSADFLGLHLGWLIPALLLAMALAALLAYLLWRCCRTLMERRRLKLERERALRAAKKKAPKKPEQPKKPPKIDIPKPRPPTPPPPEKEPFVFNFWTETYPDRFQRHMPKRDELPKNVTEDKEVWDKDKVEEEEEKEERRKERQKVEEEYQNKVEKYKQELQEVNEKRKAAKNPPPLPPPPPPKKKNSFCLIL